MRLSHTMWHSDDGATILISACFLSQKHHTLPLLVIMISWSRSTIMVLENIPHAAFSIIQSLSRAKCAWLLTWQNWVMSISVWGTGTDRLEMTVRSTAGILPWLLDPPLDHTHTSSPGAAQQALEAQTGPSGLPSESSAPHEHCFSLSTCFHMGPPSPGRSLWYFIWMEARGVRMKVGWVMPEMPFLEAR